MSDNPSAEWLDFYRSFFPTEDDAERFVVECENRRPLRHPSRLIMHQCKRLVSVAQDMGSMQPSYHALQVCLLLMCAEAVAKLHDGTRPQGNSKAFVRRFFTDLLPADQQARLVHGLRDGDDSLLSIAEVANHLYSVRCDVAHEGQYSSMFFSSDGISTGSRGWPLWATISLQEMYEIIVAGCVAAARDVLHEDIEVPRPE